MKFLDFGTWQGMEGRNNKVCIGKIDIINGWIYYEILIDIIYEDERMV